jgi:hypothetical protein
LLRFGNRASLMSAYQERMDLPYVLFAQNGIAEMNLF